MLVLVDHSAEAVVSTDGEAFDPIGFKRLGQGAQRCCCGE